MVTRFTSEGLGQRFTKFTPIANIKDNIVLSTSADVGFTPFEPDITKVNGVWTITRKGAVAGIVLDQLIGGD